MFGMEPIIYGGVSLQELLNFTPFLIPCIAVDIVGLLYLIEGKKFVNALKDPRVRVILMIAFAAFPISTAGWVLYSWLYAIL